MSDMAKRLADEIVVARAELVILLEQQRITRAEILAKFPDLRDWTHD